MQVPFLDLKLQFQNIKDEVLPVVLTAMENAAFIGGPQVELLESEFASYCDSRYCVGVNSGTDALRFALLAADIGPGDEVITVPNTFIATTEAISQTGAKPVFVDIQEDTSNINVNLIKAKLSNKTKAIVPVHLYGQPADMEPIMNIAEKHNLVVIEDACQAHGALYKQRKAGSIGLAGCFSFYPGKNLGAYGEGGAVTTQDQKLTEKIKMLRDHGQKMKYFHEIEGYNGRLDAIQAGILRIKLKQLDVWNASRRKNAQLYNELLSDVDEIKLPKELDFVESVYHLYVIHTRNPKQRDELQNYLKSKQIATGLHYPQPLHMQNAYRHFGYKREEFPVTEKAAQSLLSLPMFPELTTEQINYVCTEIKNFFSEIKEIP